ncbi:hypothetical protein [Cryptosporidium parvum Iowa II]|uniref:Uncharacterized protein n=2 Tax=Cryptosporidium parvum TaxID=5807 RepID=Q5CW79_CRYPI|nr:hypothetical protein [Cryptosporidium parvum Iowa II]EAK89349.1 hypothetical protein, signal peptide, possible secreted protein [Cryptosporidium parvum Iowa II]QOY39884.1 Uncharacterized protein CPATCC_0001380 [Cryptosporidium parvum]WKS79382.1 putative signal peptide-containing protein [Cryptosporidium sp. 43IA8]WRK33881.1 Uncharacterized protein cpbgf_8001330 [Cryptosporidium parvum]|eukprot:QOY39884.1 hypothetical protein CPATCC_003938 [Cryptosporidium parvum]
MKYCVIRYRKWIILLIIIEFVIKINLLYGLRNNVFGQLVPQQLLANSGLLPPNLVNNANLPTTSTSTQATTIIVNNPQQNTGNLASGGSFLNELFKKPSIEQLNKDIKEIMQKESSSKGFGICLFTSNPYLDLGFRDLDYEKCTKFLLSMDTWLDESTINSLIQEQLIKNGLSIPSKKKFKVPALEVLYKETFLQVCVTFFVGLVSSGLLEINNKTCTGNSCHDQFNAVCNVVFDTYGKSASILGGPTINDVVKTICQESRRQIASKYQTLISSPADIRSDNVSVEASEPIPT